MKNKVEIIGERQDFIEFRKNPAAVALGQLGGKANTPAQQAARKAVAIENGKKGGRPAAHYYATHWPCGYGATHANNGGDFVYIYRFDSRAERDDACENFRAPNHCPTARLEPTPSADANVRQAVRVGSIMEWL